jgi:uncharacterized protein
MKLQMVRAFFLGFVFLALFTAPAIVISLDVPLLRGRVNDYANLIPSDRALALEQRLEQFENSTGHQIAVLTIPGLHDEDIEGFSIRVAENWKIGRKGFDNGAIFVIAQNDRKLRIEVGYGLEGVLPDAIANRIIQEIIVPRFRGSDFAGGIEAGVEAIMKVASGEPLPQAQRKKPASSSQFPVEILLPLILIGFYLVATFSSRTRHGIWSTQGRNHNRPGGIFSGGIGGGGFGGGGGGGFSGGGGGFGGGGASGNW